MSLATIFKSAKIHIILFYLVVREKPSELFSLVAIRVSRPFFIVCYRQIKKPPGSFFGRGLTSCNEHYLMTI